MATSVTTTFRRLHTIDLARALAIVLMVGFHFVYDLRFFGYVDFNIPDGAGWAQFRAMIVGLFLLCAGSSLALAHGRHIQWKKFTRRQFQIVAGAAAVSAASWLTVPNNYIYFGILHFIAAASLVALALVKIPRASLLAGCAIILASWASLVSGRWPFTPIDYLLPAYSNDYVSVFPWLGVLLIGVWLGHQRFFQCDPLARAFAENRAVQVLGQHSLLIYLLHQPIFFAGFYAVSIGCGWAGFACSPQ
ncbi:MAG: DUF1624 domain-containing protein [Limnobacter sp.]|nr:DUF1624 domain-containing protein [Limnobacter sp.]